MCFELENEIADLDYITWTPDGQFMWWIECNSNCSYIGDELSTYDLIIADVANRIYGVVLENIGIHTKIAFVEETNQ